MNCLSAGNTSPHAQLRMGVRLQLGRQALIPQNGLCFHPKNTANTHLQPEMSCVSLGWRDAEFSCEGIGRECLMGAGVEIPGRF